MTVGRMALKSRASRVAGRVHFKRVVLSDGLTGLRKALPGNNIRM